MMDVEGIGQATYEDRECEVAETPKYSNPPVVETVMGVQFPEIEGFRAAHFGLYWKTIADRYPKASDKPRLDPAREVFHRYPINPTPRLQFMQRSQPDRVWFTSESESKLVQLQPDRFHFNWRRGSEDKPYPSYDKNSDVFFSEFESFRQFCESQAEITAPNPEVCEVTYVNHIKPVEGETVMELAGRVFNGLRWELGTGFLAIPERFNFNRSFVINHQEKPVGRLHAESSIGLKRQDSELREFVVLNLTGRVMVDAASGLELTKAMQLAHDWVVCGFADLTDKQIQYNRWERQ